METKLFKIEDWYRVLHIRLENGNVIELGNIIVYDEKGIIIDTGYGYFDNDVEISIDTWPLIPTYVEFEAKSENNI